MVSGDRDAYGPVRVGCLLYGKKANVKSCPERQSLPWAAFSVSGLTSAYT
jgi:hypothetical protein